MTVEMLTPQQIFNKVARHLLTQNQRSVDPTSDKCRYHDQKTNIRCAIGGLFASDVDITEIEGVGITSIESYLLSPDSIITKRREGTIKKLIQGLKQSGVNCVSNFNLLLSLQRVHDWRQCDVWKETLQDIGNQYHLDCSVLGEFQ